MLGFATIISSLELLYLAGRREFGPGGTWDWSVIGTATAPRSHLVDPVFKYPGSFAILLTARFLAGTSCILLPWGDAITTAVLIGLVLIQMGLNMRIVFGDDGSDSMLSITLATLALGGLSHGNVSAETICLVFLA
ncbi:hypothetical protein M3147_19095, partial [Agromyces mediolanus]|uniref:hypothetical protein n=1 Tax=Agromyces mediolanus TaxID=41986 RepID=UPI0020419076